MPDVGSFAALNALAWSPQCGLWAVGFAVDQVSSKAIVLQRGPTSWLVVDPPDADDLFSAAATTPDVWAADGPAIFAHTGPSAHKADAEP